MSFEELPLEVLKFEFLIKCDMMTIINICQTSKKYRDIIQDDNLWKFLLKRDFNYEQYLKDSYKETYIECYGNQKPYISINDDDFYSKKFCKISVILFMSDFSTYSEPILSIFKILAKSHPIIKWMIVDIRNHKNAVLNIGATPTILLYKNGIYFKTFDRNKIASYENIKTFVLQ